VTAHLQIPDSIKPADGRFGSGPSKVRPAALEALAATGTSYLGTSHRQAGVRSEVNRLRRGISEFFAVPDGYEVVLGLGGTHAFWDSATFGLIRSKAQLAAFGEFGAKFAEAVGAAPFLEPPSVRSAAPGTAADLVAEDGIDVYATTHNETSTGVSVPVRRIGSSPAALMLHDATSAAASLDVDVRETDAYYFSLQKGLGSEGGLWIAVLSPAAIARAYEIKAGGRYIPPFLDLVSAIENSRLDQTLNTPALATIFLAAEQTDWLNANGGLAWATKRTAESAAILYGWADRSAYATPFVSDPDRRSHAVATIDFDASISADQVAATLRANGIVDTESYRKLGRNQLRIALFPAIEPADVEALTLCIDYIAENLEARS
jgi:phosphoserine aminotransferase